MSNLNKLLWGGQNTCSDILPCAYPSINRCWAPLAHLCEEHLYLDVLNFHINLWVMLMFSCVSCVMLIYIQQSGYLMSI